MTDPGTGRTTPTEGSLVSPRTDPTPRHPGSVGDLQSSEVCCAAMASFWWNDSIHWVPRAPWCFVPRRSHQEKVTKIRASFQAKTLGRKCLGCEMQWGKGMLEPMWSRHFPVKLLASSSSLLRGRDPFLLFAMETQGNRPRKKSRPRVSESDSWDPLCMAQFCSTRTVEFSHVDPFSIN